MKSSSPLISEALAQTAQRALDTHAAPISGLQLALLATPDGFEIACLRNRSDLQANRLSAMASSLMAMARAVGREIQSPQCKRLTFEAEGSTVVFQSSMRRCPASCAWCWAAMPCSAAPCGPRVRWCRRCPGPDAPAIDFWARAFIGSLRPLPFPASVNERQGNEKMATLNESLNQLQAVEGALCAAIVDSGSGMLLGSIGTGVDMELAAAGNTEVVRAKNKTMQALGLQDTIDDILITLGKQYHIIRPLATKEGIFIYMVLDKARANLALARRKVQDVEKLIEF